MTKEEGFKTILSSEGLQKLLAEQGKEEEFKKIMDSVQWGGKISHKMVKKENININVDDELYLLCVRCTGKTSHKVVVSVDSHFVCDCIVCDCQQNSVTPQQAYLMDLNQQSHYQIVQCNGCKEYTFRLQYCEDTYETIDGECLTLEHEHLYPSRIEGRKTLADIHYLPSQVRCIYKETHQALNGESYILAGIGLRALIETVCKEKNAKGKDLFKKIDDLVIKQILTPEGAEILHKIRTLGNIAAHEVKPQSETQLCLAMDVVEHLLIAVYILPQKVEAELKDLKKTKQP